MDVANLGHKNGIPLSLDVVIDYFSPSYLKMYEIDIKRTLNATFLDCLALMFYEYIGDLLPEWAYLAYRTGQSADLTVIGNLVFTPSRDLVFPLSRDQRN